MNVNDAKYARLLAETGENEGQIDDLETLWLNNQIVGPVVGNETINGLWNLYMDQFGLKDLGDLNDKFYAWLGGQGYTGDLTDRWLQFWLDTP